MCISMKKSNMFSILCMTIIFCATQIIAHNDEWTEIPTTNDKITFIVALKQNQDGIQKLEDKILNEISNHKSKNYGKFLSIEEAEAYTMPKKIHKHKAMRFLRMFDCQDMFDAMRCVGSVQSINNKFKIDLKKYRHKSGMEKYTSHINYVIPESVSDSIDFIDGLCNALPAQRNMKKTSFDSDFTDSTNSTDSIDSTVDPGAVTREVLMRTYGLSDTFTGNNVSIGVMEYFIGNGYSNEWCHKESNFKKSFNW